jgi:Uma2 family endonuclease
MVSQTLLSISDFLSLPEPEDCRYELDEGELVVVAFPEFAHNRTVWKICSVLNEFVKRNRLGQVFPMATPYVLDQGRQTVRKPDISFVSTDRLSKLAVEECIYGVPDLSIEVKCPTRPGPDMKKRTEQYLTAGVKSFWVVCPKTCRADIFEPNGTKRRIELGGLIEVPEVLPGFSVLVDKFFEEF